MIFGGVKMTKLSFSLTVMFMMTALGLLMHGPLYQIQTRYTSLTDLRDYKQGSDKQ